MSKASRRQAYQKGREGENIALRYLGGLGYHLLTRNFRVWGQAPSEIDLILLAPDARAPVAFRHRFRQAAEAEELDPLLSREEGLRYLVLVFAEVKNWSSYPTADLSYNLNHQRQQRMFQTAECFLQRHPEYAVLPRRFDLLILEPGEPTVQVRHIEAALP